MRKLTEIDAIESYQQTGMMPWLYFAAKHRLKSEWVEQAFTQAQQQFLEKHKWCARPHPRHNPTIEIFIDEQTLTERDWTVIQLLF